MATAKGHMAQNKKNMWSTTKQYNAKEGHEEKNKCDDIEDYHPYQQPMKTNTVYLVLKLAKEFDHTLYIDLTGKFPVTSQAGNKYILVAYDYDSNTILDVPVPNQSDSSLTKAINYAHTYLTERGFKPALNVLDNKASTAVKRYIKSTGAKLQPVELHNHQ
eukprot:14393063-Ditylum_brightwellii.AAC.1